jgi:hypothetical protein
MFVGTANSPENQLPADAYHHLIRTLRLTLPPPPDDTPEALRRRDHAAIAAIAGLAPANAAEADLAAQFVAASAQWKDCLRLAQVPETTPEWAAKCRAQALAMMRQANAALRLLLRLQQARGKLEADNGACDRANWTEHCAIALMAEALAPPTPPPDLAATPPTPEPALPPARAEEPAPSAPPRAGSGEGTGPAAPVEAPDAAAEAQLYATLYPERAALIRRLGRLRGHQQQGAELPVLGDLPFGPPDDHVVQALIAGRGPVLAAPDGLPAGEANRVPDRAAAEARAA